MEFVTIDGEDSPRFIFKPYVWAIAKDHYNCITFEKERKNHKEIEIFMKEGYYNGNKRKQIIKVH